MTIELAKDVAEFVQERVRAGHGHDAGDLVNALLRIAREEWVAETEEWKADARRKIEEGLAQAKAGQLLTPEQVRASLDARKAAWMRERGIA